MFSSYQPVFNGNAGNLTRGNRTVQLKLDKGSIEALSRIAGVQVLGVSTAQQVGTSIQTIQKSVPFSQTLVTGLAYSFLADGVRTTAVHIVKKKLMFMLMMLLAAIAIGKSFKIIAPRVRAAIDGPRTRDVAKRLRLRKLKSRVKTLVSKEVIATLPAALGQHLDVKKFIAPIIAFYVSNAAAAMTFSGAVYGGNILQKTVYGATMKWVLFLAYMMNRHRST
jgi:hypothetical protein